MKFDSKDEEYIALWLEELKNNDIIIDYDRSISYELNNGLSVNYNEIKELKTKSTSKEKKQVLIPIKVYTPDFEVIWNKNNILIEKFIDFLYEDKKKDKLIYKLTTGAISSIYTSTIEVKPIFDMHSMTRLFKTNQAIMWDKYNIYVNLVNYQDLFEKTFTPKKYILTEKTLKERKIKWKVKTLEEFINNK